MVITGLGPVTPIGIGKEDFWKALISGKSGIGYISYFDTTDFSVKIAGEVSDFDPDEFIPPQKSRHMDRFTHFAIAASKLALDDAKLTIDSSIADRVGVVIGSGVGGLHTMETQHKVLLEKGPRRVSPFLVPMMICDLAAGEVSIFFGAKGPNICIVTACASGTHAIGEAFQIIKRGDGDIIICGGTEAAITPLGVAGFAACRALSGNNNKPEKASRPFDKDRDGFVMSEGAGIIILESLESAWSRDAHIYAEVVGYGSTGDAYHITAPDPEALQPARAMQLALEQANISPEEVDYINAHGTSTPYNDEFETMAIKKVFKEHAYKLVVSSTKSMTGHLLAAAGGIELIACVMAIENGIIPPTINLDNVDPKCDPGMNYVPYKAIHKNVKVAISNSFGFGGHNASLVIRNFQ